MTSDFILVTWPGFLFALLSGGLQAGAHFFWARSTGRLERYAIGTLIIGACFTAGWLFDQRAHPVVAFWHTVGWSGLLTWLCYRLERPADRPPETPEADDFLRKVSEELGEQ